MTVATAGRCAERKNSRGLSLTGVSPCDVNVLNDGS